MQGDQFQPSFYFFKNSLVLYLKTITYPKIAFCQFNVLDSQKNLLRALYGLLAFKRRYNESVKNESPVLSFIYLHHLVLFISTILFLTVHWHTFNLFLRFSFQKTWVNSSKITKQLAPARHTSSRHTRCVK